MICGVDEAGRGPCFGPLVVVGILVENDAELVRIGACDSSMKSLFFLLLTSMICVKP